MNIEDAVWYVVHVHDDKEQHATFRVGLVYKDKPVTTEDAVKSAFRLCVARGMVAPYDTIAIGPLTEHDSHVIYDGFDGVRANDKENQQLIRNLNKQGHGVWLNGRVSSN